MALATGAIDVRDLNEEVEFELPYEPTPRGLARFVRTVMVATGTYYDGFAGFLDLDAQLTVALLEKDGAMTPEAANEIRLFIAAVVLALQRLEDDPGVLIEELPVDEPHASGLLGKVAATATAVFAGVLAITAASAVYDRTASAQVTVANVAEHAAVNQALFALSPPPTWEDGDPVPDYLPVKYRESRAKAEASTRLALEAAGLTGHVFDIDEAGDIINIRFPEDEPGIAERLYNSAKGAVRNSMGSIASLVRKGEETLVGSLQTALLQKTAQATRDNVKVQPAAQVYFEELTSNRLFKDAYRASNKVSKLGTGYSLEEWTASAWLNDVRKHRSKINYGVMGLLSAPRFPTLAEGVPQLLNVAFSELEKAQPEVARAYTYWVFASQTMRNKIARNSLQRAIDKWAMRALMLLVFAPVFTLRGVLQKKHSHYVQAIKTTTARIFDSGLRVSTLKSALRSNKEALKLLDGLADDVVVPPNLLKVIMSRANQDDMDNSPLAISEFEEEKAISAPRGSPTLRRRARGHFTPSDIKAAIAEADGDLHAAARACLASQQ